LRSVHGFFSQAIDFTLLRKSSVRFDVEQQRVLLQVPVAAKWEMSSLEETFFPRTAVLIVVELLHIASNQANFVASDAL